LMRAIVFLSFCALACCGGGGAGLAANNEPCEALEAAEAVEADWGRGKVERL
jgi:hypothetical protein